MTKEFSAWLEKGAMALNLSLTPVQVEMMSIHARELLLWNRKMNLTAITEIKDVAEKHFLDALAAGQTICQTGRMLDIGSGGGFPAIPLKVMDEGLDVTMVDAVRKKVSFLNHVVRTTGLAKISALHARVEQLASDPGLGHRYDIITARGFADLEKLVSLAAALLAPKGKIYALKGSHGVREITPWLEARFHISQEQYRLPFGKDQRFIIILQPRPPFS